MSRGWVRGDRGELMEGILRSWVGLSALRMTREFTMEGGILMKKC